MQFAKDSFYIALRDRLAVVNPARTVVVNGATRPAILNFENEVQTDTALLPDAFYLSWGAVAVAKGWESATRPMMAMECKISYGTQGSAEAGNDRGRTLAALDMELLCICSPAQTIKKDWTQVPSQSLGTNVAWSGLHMGEVGVLVLPAWSLSRVAQLTVFFFPEVDLP